MTSTAATVDKLGRIVIPANYRRELGLKPGDKLHVSVKDGELRLISIHTAVRRAQEALKPYRPKDGRLASEELLKERREEAARE